MASDRISEEVPLRNRLIDAGLWNAADERDPSQSIEAAWQVVEQMRELMWGMVIWNSWPLSSVGRGFAVRFYRGVYPPSYEEGEWFEGGEMGLHCPLAICRAALAAVQA